MNFKLITEKRKPKKVFQKLDAGNVPYNNAMFNKMSTATESPSTNPTGPMGESVKINEGYDKEVLDKLLSYIPDENIIISEDTDNYIIQFSTAKYLEVFVEAVLKLCNLAYHLDGNKVILSKDDLGEVIIRNE